MLQTFVLSFWPKSHRDYNTHLFQIAFTPAYYYNSFIINMFTRESRLVAHFYSLSTILFLLLRNRRIVKTISEQNTCQISNSHITEINTHNNWFCFISAHKLSANS